MTLGDLIKRVRSYTRDTTGTLFEYSDVKDFINEGIDRLRQIKALEGMIYLSTETDEPKFLTSQYHYALAIYSASRCYTQDEQTSFAETFMREFEGLFSLIELGIKEGTIIIVDGDGNTVVSETDFDGVTNVYF